MSSSDQIIFDSQHEDNEKRLAKQLGIKYKELQELNYTIDTHESDEGIIYYYIIKFSDESPKQITPVQNK